MPRKQGLTGRRVSIVAAAKHRLNRLNETRDEKCERLKIQREYSRRRRALESEEDRAQRLALDSQRRKRKRVQVRRLKRKSEGQNLPLRKDVASAKRPRSGSTGALTDGGILEPEISLLKSYNPGFMKFMMSIHGEAIAQNSSMANMENAELGPNQGTSMEDCKRSPMPIQACDNYERKSDKLPLTIKKPIARNVL